MRAGDQPVDLSDAGSETKPWATLILLGLAQFMVILDITVVNVALPSIQEDLAFSAGDLQWVITAYVLFTGGLLLLGGRATDLFGRRRVFLAGLGTFTLASRASGLASSPQTLIAAPSRVRDVEEDVDRLAGWATATSPSTPRAE